MANIRVGDIVPYSCVFIDATFKDLLKATKNCFATDKSKSIEQSTEKLVELFKRPGSHILPCLSVRSAFDLLLSAAGFESGSEIIMSALNIPAMASIARHHGLTVVPLDVDIDTMKPKFNLLLQLITARTVVILLAHIYGSVFDIESFLKVARDRGILVVEDCAESFNGLDSAGYLGNPMSDASFHSFGVIKRRTCFGGAIARIKDDQLFRRMVDIHETYERQTNWEYQLKLIKYVGLYVVLNVPLATLSIVTVAKWTGWNHRKSVVNLLRNFTTNLIAVIRRRPSASLLLTMSQRLGDAIASSQVRSAIAKSSSKRALISTALPLGVGAVGRKANVELNWLFPVVAADAVKLSTALNRLGVDSYTGSTQLTAILPEESESVCCCTPNDATAAAGSRSALVCPFPHDAKYLVDHVVYLPVHQLVPDEYLPIMRDALTAASEECIASNRQEQKSKL